MSARLRKTINVDNNALKYNYQQIQNYVGKNVSVMPILKGNGYGLGLEKLSPALNELRPRFVGVTDAQEALRIAHLCPETIPLVLYQPNIDDIPCIINNRFHIAISEMEFLQKLNQKAHLVETIIPIHLNLDIGYGAIGIQPNQIQKFCEEISKMKGISVKGVFSHFSSLSPEVHASQKEKFEMQAKTIEQRIGKVEYKHICSGSAMLSRKDTHYDIVRPGSLFYGYYEQEKFADMINVKPSFNVATNIISIRDLSKGTPIGYDGEFVCERDSRIATLPIGYCDGLGSLMHRNGASFVINDQRAPIVSGMSMNLSTIDLTNVKGKVNLGDEVFIFDNKNVTFEEVVKSAEKSPEEFMINICRNA